MHSRYVLVLGKEQGVCASDKPPKKGYMFYKAKEVNAEEMKKLWKASETHKKRKIELEHD